MELAGKRLDQALAELFPDYSRARLQQWLRAGQVLVDGHQRRPRDKVLGGEEVVITLTPQQEVSNLPQPITLDVVYEDSALLVINKPAGLVVHPGAGNPQGTLLNALLHYAPELANVPRAGIVHRLDKDTSGLLVVARNLIAQKALVEQLQAHSLQRGYEAIVAGVMTAGGRIETQLGRDPRARTRMSVAREGQGKTAVTHYRVIERFRAHTHVRLQLETGRTHQIRVHMAHIRHPIIGDPDYGGRLRLPPGASEALIEALRHFKRQALHAASLGLIHPTTGELMHWSAHLPTDMRQLLQVLKEDNDAGLTTP
jgi:23S rRNA pseudouridine1911/1915/1917 synthase